MRDHMALVLLMVATACNDTTDPTATGGASAAPAAAFFAWRFQP